MVQGLALVGVWVGVGAQALLARGQAPGQPPVPGLGWP